jgi:hypothetical protein
VSAVDDVKSVRGWLHGLYPDVPILMQRNVQGTPKPFFFLEDVSEAYTDRGRGYHEDQRTLRVHLVWSEPKTADARQEVYWRLKGVLGFLKELLVTRRVIPRWLYGCAYPAPAVSVLGTVDGGPGLPVGDHELCLTGVTADGLETLPSAVVAAPVIDGTSRYLISVAHWPRGLPLAAELRLWWRPTPDLAWAPVALQPINPNGYMTTFEVSDLTPLGPALLPTSSRVPSGYLKVTDATYFMAESGSDDDAFFGWVQFRCTARSPHVFDPVPVMGSLTADLGNDNTVTINQPA